MLQSDGLNGKEGKVTTSGYKELSLKMNTVLVLPVLERCL